MAKFSMRIDLDVLKCDTSPKLKPEVDLRRRCRHLGDVTLQLHQLSSTLDKICRPMPNHMPMMTVGPNSKSEV